MPKIFWVIVKTNSLKEAQTIGRAALKNRHAACFDILPRITGEYFWPPTKNKIEISHGPNLILETLSSRIAVLKKLIKNLHSDRLPFIGVIPIEMEPDFVKWLRGELK